MLVGLLTFLSGPVSAQEKFWFSPLTMTTSPATGLTIEPSLSPQTAIWITPATIGVFFVDLGLPLPSDVLIDSLTVCYFLQNSASFITQTRLTRMTTPDAANVLFDDATDRNAILDCYTIDVGNRAVAGAITLSLRLHFTNSAHAIEIGAVGISTLPGTTAVEEPIPVSPEVSSLLGQNRPNPFNPSTVIEYELKHEGNVRIRVFNAPGRLVRTLIEGNAEPGRYRTEWDGRDDAGRAMPSGAYYYQLSTGELEESKPMILLR
jgi:hypothetical protein